MARIFLSPPDVGPLEREYLLRAFDEGWIAPVGPDLDAFEAEISALTGWPGAVALASGTAALHLALLEVGVQPGDDVFVSTFTFAATANAVAYCGANPVFIDSDDATWNMSPELLEQALTDAAAAGRLPAAVVVVDLYGQCADYDRIVPLCQRFGVPLVEDAAEALGATYRGRPAGTFGDVGLFSFNGNKIMTTSGGGMFVSPTTETADRVRYLATQARQPAVHYEHTEIGWNYRLSNLLAAIGRAQLERLPAMSARRVEINARYRDAFAGLEGVSFMPIADPGWNGWLTCVVFDDPAVRDHVQKTLETADIESRPLWKPMHLQPVFADSACVVDGTSQRLFDHGLCLPSGSVLTDADVDRVAGLAIEAIRSRP
ncbi:MAG: aminotransferase class I/II-fold pyridoxal phosphate-dependent enzyme [Ilumatobacter sp.]|nr:MAG: aminotransferase class I/II-fold pyridoxal phosphate-dependent enzyme [Ilumatobacter sp.]